MAYKEDKMQIFIDEDIKKLTKPMKFSRKQCMKLKNNQYVRMDGNGYFRVSSIDKLHKTVDVFDKHGIDRYDFEEVMYDKTCLLLDKMYKMSKKFRATYGDGIGEGQQLSNFFNHLDTYVQEPENVVQQILK